MSYAERIKDRGEDETRADELVSDPAYLQGRCDEELIRTVEYWLAHQEEMPLWGHTEVTDAVIANVAQARANKDDSDGDDFYVLAAAICEAYSCHYNKAPQCYRDFYKTILDEAFDQVIEEYKDREESAAEYRAEAAREFDYMMMAGW